ncbi:MAG: hypothetical protein M1823_006416, partial [Watsoniomyces obsoletus]
NAKEPWGAKVSDEFTVGSAARARKVVAGRAAGGLRNVQNSEECHGRRRLRKPKQGAPHLAECRRLQFLADTRYLPRYKADASLFAVDLWVGSGRSIEGFVEVQRFDARWLEIDPRSTPQQCRLTEKPFWYLEAIGHDPSPLGHNHLGSSRCSPNLSTEIRCCGTLKGNSEDKDGKERTIHKPT